MSNNNPSLDPANNDSLAGSITFAFNKLMQNVNGMLPAKVILYDRAENRVSVQLLINIITTGGTQVARPQISSVPVFQMGGGGFFLSFPLKTGDLGWVLANDRDISLFLQSYEQSQPNTMRVKNFADSLFMPDIMTNYTFDSGNDNDFVIQSTDGNTIISVSTTAITLTSPIAVNINAPAMSFDLGNPVNILNVNGSIVATGTITP